MAFDPSLIDDANKSKIRVKPSARPSVDQSNIVVPVAVPKLCKDALSQIDEYTEILVCGGDSDGSVNIVDISPYRHTISTISNVAHDTAESKYNSSSLNFSSTTRYLQFEYSIRFDVLNGLSWTLECWVKMGNTGAHNRLWCDFGASGWILNRDNANKFVWSTSGGTITGSTTTNTTDWYHVAVVCDGSEQRLYVNGTEEGTALANANVADGKGNLAFGRIIGQSSYDFYGWADDLRFSTVCRYIENFTPPTRSFKAPLREKITVISTDESLQHQVETVPNNWRGKEYRVVSSLCLDTAADFAKATTENTGYYAQYSFDRSKSLTGAYTGTQWLGTTVTNQKLNIDLGYRAVVTKFIINNSHGSGISTDMGINNFILYGSNSKVAYDNTTYSNTDNLVELGTYQAAEHFAGNWTDPEVFYVDNEDAYRYYIFRIADNHGNGTYIGVRQIDFYTDVAHNYLMVDQSEGDNYEQAHSSYPGSGFDGVINGGSAPDAWYAAVANVYQNTGYVGKDYGVGNGKCITRLGIYNTNTDDGARNYTFQGSFDGTTWDTLLTITDAFYASLKWVFHDFENDENYRYYRVNVTQNWGDVTYLIIRELVFFEKFTNQATVNAKLPTLYAEEPTDGDALLMWDESQDDNTGYVGGRGDITLNAPSDGLYLASDSSPTTSTLTTGQSGIVDGNITTGNVGSYWNGNETYGIDLGFAKDISRLNLHCSHAGGVLSTYYGSSYDSFSVYKSDNNSTWTLVESFDAPPFEYSSNYANIALTLSSVQTARYFKVVHTDTGLAFGGGGASGALQEIEAYSSPAHNVWSLCSSSFSMAQDPTNAAPQLLDSTIGEYDGTAVGTPLTNLLSEEDELVGITLDGTDDGFTTADNFGVTDYPFTVFSVFKAADLTAECPIISGDDASNYIGLSVIVGTSGQIKVRLGDGTGVTSADYYEWYTANSLISTGEVYSVGIVITSFTSVEVYINGLLIATSTTGTGASADLTNALYRIGTSAADSTFFYGTLYKIFTTSVVSSDTILAWHRLYREVPTYAGLSVGEEKYEFSIPAPPQPSSLSNFPVQLQISRDSGLNGFDATKIFNGYRLGQREHPDVEPASHYTMDNVSGTTLVDEKGNTNGTISNLTQTVNGKFGYYLAGGAISATIRNIDFGAGNLSFQTVSFWFRKITTTTQNDLLNTPNYLVARETAAGSYISVYISSYGDTDLTVTDTEWHHFVAVETTNSNTYRFYLDGVAASADSTTNWAGSIRYFGRPATYASGEVPDVDNLQFYSTKFTEVQIQDLYRTDKLRFKTDQHHASTVLYLESNDVDGSSDFYDSVGGNALAVGTGTCEHKNTQTKFGKSSVYFNDATRLDITPNDSTDFEMDGMFTVDAWVYPTGAGSLLWANYEITNKLHTLFVDGDGNARILLDGSTRFSGMDLPYNQWSHYALVRDEDDEIRAYINGYCEGMYRTATEVGGAGAYNFIGGTTSAGHAGSGYVQGLRIIKGVCLYKGVRFVPPICLPSAPDFRKLQIKQNGVNLYGEVDVWNTWDEDDLNAVIQVKGSLDTTNVPITINFDPTNADNSAYVDRLSDGIYITASDGLHYDNNTSPTSTALNSEPSIADGSLGYYNHSKGAWYADDSYGIDLGSAQTVDYLVACCGGGDYTWNATFDEVEVFKSNDNSTWTSVESFHPPPKINGATSIFSFKCKFSTPQTARYFQIHATVSLVVGSSTNLTCYEIQAFRNRGNIAVWQGAGVRFGMGQPISNDDILMVKDSSSNQNDGTPSGTMVASDQVPAEIGNAYQYDGTDDYVESEYAMPSSDWTAEILFRKDTLEATSGIVASESVGAPLGGTPHWLLRDDSGSLDSYGIANAYQTIAEISAGDWNHVVVKRNSTPNEYYYLNGEYIGIVARSTAGDRGAIFFGAGYNGYSEVTIADFRIYETEQSEDWVVASYQSIEDSLFTWGYSAAAGDTEPPDPEPEPDASLYVKPTNMFLGFPAPYKGSVSFPNQVKVNKVMLPKYTNFSGGGSF